MLAGNRSHREVQGLRGGCLMPLTRAAFFPTYGEACWAACKLIHLWPDAQVRRYALGYLVRVARGTYLGRVGT